MSLYNMMNGANPAVFFVLPMLGKHPDKYPRFRDCFVTEEDKIEILTRTGGGNRESYEEENDEITKMKDFVRDFDDEDDSTYARWVFNVPKEFKKDFDLLMEGEIKNTSNKYKERLYEVFPLLKDSFDKIFNVEEGK